MKTSTYNLSTSQQWIFTIVIMLGLLFAGCDDNPSSPESPSVTTTTPQAPPSLEDRWIGVEQNGQRDGYTMLHLFGSGGIYRSYPSESIVKEEYMEFEYERINNFQLQVSMITHQINGESQQISRNVEKVYYTLNENTLQIFGHTFARE